MLGTLSMDSRFSNLIDGTMTVEKKSLNKLQAKLEIVQHQKDNYATLKNGFTNYQTLVKTLSNPADFRTYKIEDDFDGELMVTPDGNATSGFYSIDVTQTALEGKKASTGFADKDASIGQTGTIQITVNGSSFDVAVTNLNDNLQEIKETINNASDNDLVRAGIINVDDGFGGIESRLVMTTNNTGASQNIQVTDVSGTVAATLDISTVVQAPRDSTITLDGFNISSESNVLHDVIEGLTIEIFSVTTTTRKFNVAEDNEEMKQRINDFVDAQNNTIKNLDSMGENATKVIKRDINKIILDIEGRTGKHKLLADIGIAVNTKTGLYEIDDDKLSDALKTDYNEVQKLFSEKDVGIAVELEAYFKNLLDIEGSINLSKKSLDSKIRTYDKKIERESDRLEKFETALRKRYAALEKNVSYMESTQEYLKTQMTNLTNMRSSNK